MKVLRDEPARAGLLMGHPKLRGAVLALLTAFPWAFAAAATGHAAGAALISTPRDPNGPKKIVTIQRGWGPITISRELSRQGIVASPWSFVLFARLGTKAATLKAGEYELSAALPLRAVMEKILRGDVVRVSVTVPEGLTVAEVAGLLEAAGLGHRDGFSRLAHDPSFARATGAPASNLEGYLFPDTYQFAKGVNEQTVLAAMVHRWKEVFSGEDLGEEAHRLNLSTAQAVILASIIEKEAKAPEERALISAVFHNRLSRGIPLQSDPTVIYGIENFNGNLTRKNLEAETPYNTYRVQGLPPGPIANPGKASLYAAVHPAQVDYLYFVSRNDGTHEFSRTLEEHNRAVARFQLHRGGQQSRRPGP